MKFINKKVVLFFCVAIILEVFLFNFRFWTSLNYEKLQLHITDVGEGLEEVGENKYKFNFKDNSYIEIKDIKEKINNLYIDFDCHYKSEDINRNKGYRQFVSIYMTDEGNGEYYKMPIREISEGVERSKYIQFNTSGQSENLKILLERDDSAIKLRGNIDYYLTFNEISINKPVPFQFMPIRFLIILLVLGVLWCIRFETRLFEIDINLKDNKQKIILIGTILLNILFALFIYKNNLIYYTWDRGVYTNLAEALLRGHFDLPMLEVPEKLAYMENPYDTNLRSAYGIKYYWDYAFFNGKYYVYFGIVPCLLLFLPLKAIFNYDLPVNLAMLCYTIVYILIAFKFVLTLFRKIFKNKSFLMYMMTGELVAFASALNIVFLRNDLYGIPIITALSFSMLGLDLWLNSLDEDKNVKSGKKLFLGSLCLALAVGCRPQFALASFFAVFIFKDTLRKKATIDGFEKKDIRNIIVFWIPYVVVACFLMYYNYARFGSITDFGALYNLTTNDMTKRGFRLARLPFGLFAYLFQPLNIITDFPYIVYTPCTTKYMGVTIWEGMKGGVFMLTPMLYANFMLLSKGVRKDLDEKKLLKPVMAAIIFTLIILVADINMAGIVYRYIMDFTWLLLISGIAVYMNILNNAEKGNAKRLRFIYSIVFVISMIINVSFVFSRSDHFTMDATNPDVFCSIMYGLQFWM